MSKWLKYISFVLIGLILMVIVCLKPVDRTPYQEMDFYQKMAQRIDSLNQTSMLRPSSDTLLIGWARVNITPEQSMPLAGYGGRNPKAFESVKDSIYTRAIVFHDGVHKAAYVAVDLLIVHPEITQILARKLAEFDWDIQQVFLTATHSHSSIGGWAPGLVGNLLSGEFQKEIPAQIAESITQSIVKAEQKLAVGYVSFNELQATELVKNRLVKDQGQIDPWLKLFGIMSGDQRGYLTTFSAHATCLSRHTHWLSGDFPGRYTALLEQDSTIDFAAYAAGAVGSMGPRTIDVENEYLEVTDYSQKLSEYVALLQRLAPEYTADVNVDIWRIPLELRAPEYKILKNISLRPWLFRKLFGDYHSELSILRIGKTIFLGLPGDFSGELALPLYESAQKRGLNLVINSFNGGYIGYIIKDQWYDLNKYEARTMSWYGPDNGAYISEVIRRIIVGITI